jgi:hypothetical protein
MDHNRAWAGGAPVLVLAASMRERFSPVAGAIVPYPHSPHDLGLAVMSFILQGRALGLYSHPLAGFEPDLARQAFAVPPLFEPMIVLAVGYLGDADALPDALRARELAPRTRRSVDELVYEGAWGEPSTLFALDVDDAEQREGAPTTERTAADQTSSTRTP